MLSARRFTTLFIVIAAPLALITIDYAWNHQGEITTPEQVSRLQLLAIPMVICTLLLLVGPWVVARRDSRRRGTLVLCLAVLYTVLSFGAAVFAPFIVSAIHDSGTFTSEASDELLLWINILTYAGLAVYVAAIVLACHSAVRLHCSKAVMLSIACALISAILFVTGAAIWPLWPLAMLLHAAGWTTILLVLFKNEPVTTSA